MRTDAASTCGSGHEVDLAACGAYSPYDALKVCDTPEIFLKTGFEQRPMLYTQKHLFQALTPKSDYNPHRHGFSIEQVKRFPELLASPGGSRQQPDQGGCSACHPSRDRCLRHPLIAGIKPDGTGNYGEREVGDEYGLERLPGRTSSVTSPCYGIWMPSCS